MNPWIRNLLDTQKKTINWPVGIAFLSLNYQLSLISPFLFFTSKNDKKAVTKKKSESNH